MVIIKISGREQSEILGAILACIGDDGELNSDAVVPLFEKIGGIVTPTLDIIREKHGN